MSTAFVSERSNEDLAHRLHSQADQVMMLVLWILWPVSFAFAFLHSTWLLWSLAATAISLSGTMLSKLAPASLLARCGMATLFMFYAALLIHQAHGVTETHFGIFAMLAFLLYYRDWRPLVVGALVIAVHHALFYYLQSTGVPVFVFEHADMPSMVLIHAAYVIFETMVLVLLAVKLAQETAEASTLASFGSLNRSGDEIDLDSSHVQTAGAAGKGVAVFLDTIGHALREASIVAVAIRNASAELSNASGSMVTIRNQQQSDIGQVVGLVREMDGVADQVAQESERIAGEAVQCAQTAKETGESMTLTTTSIEQLVLAVQHTAEQMTELEQATSRIDSIVTMIDHIAGQTNLLALNASIEAARAGDAGRGFAVVAGEVRRLSESTQSSAKQIQEVVSSLRGAAQNAKGIAEKSRVEAERGGERMHVAEREFQGIVARFRVFAGNMKVLSESMGRQQSLMRQTDSHLSDISRILQDSSGKVESISTSGHSLESMSERLYDSVRKFRNGEERFVA